MRCLVLCVLIKVCEVPWCILGNVAGSSRLFCASRACRCCPLLHSCSAWCGPTLLEVWLPTLALASMPSISGNDHCAEVTTSWRCVQKCSCCVAFELMLVGACAHIKNNLMCWELIVIASKVGSDFQMVMSLDCIWSMGVRVVLFLSSCCWRWASGKCLSIQIWQPLLPLLEVAFITWCVGALK